MNTHPAQSGSDSEIFRSEFYRLVGEGLDDVKHHNYRSLSEAIAALRADLSLGEMTAEESGWLSPEDVDADLGIAPKVDT